jgi:hypothetical protein
MFISCGSIFSFAADTEMILCNQGKSSYAIVISSNAPSPERHAAKELQHFLREISGATLPIVEDSEQLPPRAILIGENKHLEKIGVEIDFKSLGREGYVLCTKGERLIIAGGKPRGTLYGVYGLLEDRMGCRWFTPDLSRIPKRDKLAIPSLDETVIPALEYRDVFYSDAFDGDWVLRNRMNSSQARGVEEKGGKVRFGSMAFVHTFYGLVNPKDYFDDHPEYFAEVDGTRRREGAQLCLTNPDVLRIATEKVKKWIRQDPGATIFSVSQNDCHGNCQCPSCRAIDEKEESPAGSLLYFVNSVAQEVEREFPDVIIETLAYQYTRKPPKTVRPRRNVVIRLCSIECCFCHPLETDPEGNNVSFREDIKGWNALTDRLYVWDYVTNFAHYVQPQPNLRVLKPNIRFYVKNGVKGIFEQGNYSPGKHGEMSHLRSWLLAKFLWNPDYDYETAMREFCEAYYGPAAPLIREYIDLMHDRLLETKTHLFIWAPPTSLFFDEDTVKKAEEILNRAEKIAGDNETHLLHVREAHLPIQYVQIVTKRNAGDVPYVIRGETFGPDTNHPRFSLVRSFKETATALGMSHISEGRTMESFLSEIDQPPLVYQAIRMENPATTFYVVPELGGMIPSWKLISSDYDVLFFPEGWREDFSAKKRIAGSDRKYATSRDGNNLILKSDMNDSFSIEKEFALDEKAPVLNIKTHMKNPGKKKQVPSEVQSQSWWNLGAPDQLTLWLGGSGKNALFSLDNLPQNRKSLFKFPPADAGGEWLLWNKPKKIGIRAKLPEQKTSLEFLFDPGKGRVRISESTEHSIKGEDGSSEILRRYEILTNDPAKIIYGYPQKTEPLEMKESEVRESGPDDFQLFREGELSKIMRDETAPNGWCAWMPGNTTEWAVQWHFDRELLEPGREYEAFVTVKIGKKGDMGAAFSSGVYDTVHARSMGEVRIAAKDVNPDEWKKYSIARFKPGHGQYLWIAPTANPDNVTEIRVAGFTLVGLVP